MFSFLKGIIPTETILRLHKLALSKEDLRILSYLAETTKKFRYYSTLSFISDLTFQIFLLSISLFGPFLQPYLIYNKILTLVVSTLILSFYLYFKAITFYLFNIYHRNIKTLLTIILEKFLQNYRISLATILSEIPKPNIITDAFVAGASGAINLSSKISTISSIIFTFLLGIIFFFITNSFYILLITGILFILILLTFLLLFANKNLLLINDIH